MSLHYFPLATLQLTNTNMHVTIKYSSILMYQEKSRSTTIGVFLVMIQAGLRHLGSCGPHGGNANSSGSTDLYVLLLLVVYLNAAVAAMATGTRALFLNF